MPGKVYKITQPDDILADLWRVMPRDEPNPSFRRYRALGGRYAHSTVAYVCGSWALLLQMWLSGLRTYSTASKARQSRRACLKCDRLFASDGPQNRLCTQCKETEDWKALTVGHVRLPDWDNDFMV